MISPARAAAFRILRAVDQGGWASDLLRAAPLQARDAALASEIVFGVLRRRAQLDWIISQAATRLVDRLDPEVAIALRMGVYQLHHHDRVPLRPLYKSRKLGKSKKNSVARLGRM